MDIEISRDICNLIPIGCSACLDILMDYSIKDDKRQR